MKKETDKKFKFGKSVTSMECENELSVSNYQYPESNNIVEEFEIVRIEEKTIILRDNCGNNVRIKDHPLFGKASIGEKIYKENGVFLWKT